MNKDVFNEDDDYVTDNSLVDMFPDGIDEQVREYEKKNDYKKFEEKFKDSPLVEADLEGKNEKPSKKGGKKKLKLWQKIVIALVCLFVAMGSIFGFLLYGPYPNFREWLITTAMTTMSHQYLAKWFYDDKTIEAVLKKNYVDESGESTDANQIKFVDYSKSQIMYKNKYEKEILTKGDNDIYKLINITGKGLRGYLVAIYDPSKVKVATSSRLGKSGEMLVKMAKDNNALVAMNASGFIDPNYMSNGANPHGMVIKNGKLVSNLARSKVSGGIIGFNKDNVLVLGKMDAQTALSKGIRDAVEFGPYLIVNGTPSFIKGNGGWGSAPRSAIAQRKDGIVLFLVMDGRDYAHGIDGADMVDLTEILMKYGAYNAANLDGGTSCGLVINNSLINKPISGSGYNETRAIPDAWIVTK